MSYDFSRNPRGVLKTVKYQKKSNGKKIYPELELNIPRRHNLPNKYMDSFREYSYRDDGQILNKRNFLSFGNALEQRNVKTAPFQQQQFGDYMKNDSEDIIRDEIMKGNIKENFRQRKIREKRAPYEKAAALEFAYQAPYETIRQESEIAVDPVTRKFKLQDKETNDNSIQRQISNNIQSFLLGPIKNVPPIEKKKYLPQKLARYSNREFTDITFNDFYKDKYGHDYPNNAYPNDISGGEWPKP